MEMIADVMGVVVETRSLGQVQMTGGVNAFAYMNDA
jgi:hypothetical protein